MLINVRFFYITFYRFMVNEKSCLFAKRNILILALSFQHQLYNFVTIIFNLKTPDYYGIHITASAVCAQRTGTSY